LLNFLEFFAAYGTNILVVIFVIQPYFYIGCWTCRWKIRPL